MSIIAIIPARGGSQAIKNKNLVNINGKKLIEYTIEAAKKSKKINKVVITSDSEKIIKFSNKLNVCSIKRPKNISRSNSKTFDAIKHALNILKRKKNYKPKYVVILQPTSPLRKFFHIDKALNKLIKNKEADSLVSCVNVPHNFTPKKLMIRNKKGFLIFKKKIIRRQETKLYLARNGAAIYIFNYNKVKNNLFGKNTIPFLMDKISSFDIDDHEDLNIAKKLIK